MGPPMYDPFGIGGGSNPYEHGFSFASPAAGGGSDTSAKNDQAANTNLKAANIIAGAADKIEKGAAKTPFGGRRD